MASNNIDQIKYNPCEFFMKHKYCITMLSVRRFTLYELQKCKIRSCIV